MWFRAAPHSLPTCDHASRCVTWLIHGRVSGNPSCPATLSPLQSHQTWWPGDTPDVPRLLVLRVSQRAQETQKRRCGCRGCTGAVVPSAHVRSAAPAWGASGFMAVSVPSPARSWPAALPTSPAPSLPTVGGDQSSSHSIASPCSRYRYGMPGGASVPDHP